jgi:hypothetical protein
MSETSAVSLAEFPQMANETGEIAATVWMHRRRAAGAARRRGLTSPT